MRPYGPGSVLPTWVTERAMETRRTRPNVMAAVGMRFSKPAITRSLGDEPMVTLDALALTQRIGRISQPEKPAATSPIYQSLAERQQPYEAKWRRALRPR
jgi:hypothetical protein